MNHLNEESKPEESSNQTWGNDQSSKLESECSDVGNSTWRQDDLYCYWLKKREVKIRINLIDLTQNAQGAQVSCLGCSGCLGEPLRVLRLLR
jgi:hypothetical protein